jgi:DNA polymerase III epsilon subunit-like protein
MEAFVTWLEKISNVILVAHNAKFDPSVIIRAMRDFILGFIHVHTLTLFRETFLNRKSYKQVNLCTTYYDAHDILVDSQALQRLVHLDR